MKAGIIPARARYCLQAAFKVAEERAWAENAQRNNPCVSKVMAAGEAYQNHQQPAKFQPPQGMPDRIWAIAFLIHLVGMVGLALYYGTKETDDADDVTDPEDLEEQERQKELVYNLRYLIPVMLATAGIVASVWLYIMRSFAKFLVWASLVLPTIFGILFVIVMIAAGNGTAVLFPIIIIAINLLYIYYVRNRIPFAVAMLETVVEVVKIIPGPIYIAVASILAQAAWIAVWSIGALSALGSASNSNSSDSEGSGFVLFLLLISMFWTSQVVSNVVLVCAGGAMAEWFFRYPASISKTPTKDSFKRATTSAFGSICYGSFVISVIKAMRVMVQMSRQNDNSFIRCCAECILRCLEGIIEYVNLYAFTYVSIYGMGYCDAAKSVWDLFKSRGWDVIINDDLIDGVLTWGSIFGGIVVAAVSYGFSYGALDMQSENIAFATAIGFLVGIVISMCSLAVVQGYVSSLMVCYCEDPAAMSSSKPMEYNKLTHAYQERYGGQVRMFQHA